MAQIKDSVARWYAEVNDDIRQRVVEEAWFENGHRISGNEMSRDVDATISRNTPGEQPQQFAAVYGRDPNVPEPLEGIGARGVDNPNGDAVRDATQGYYGYDQGSEAQALEADANSLYGHDNEAGDVEMSDLYGSDYDADEANMSDLYGDDANEEVEMRDLYGDDGQGQADANDLYGYERPEIEQEQ